MSAVAGADGRGGRASFMALAGAKIPQPSMLTGPVCKALINLPSKLYIYEGFVFVFTGPLKNFKGRTILRGLFGLFFTETVKNSYFTGLTIYIYTGC